MYQLVHRTMKEMVGLMASKEAEPMDVIALVVSILGLTGTVFVIGYQIGKDSNNTQK